MHGTLTVSLATQQKELPEYDNVGFSPRIAAMIPPSRLETIAATWWAWSLCTQTALKASWQAVHQNNKRPTSKLAGRFILLSYEPLVDCCGWSLDFAC